MTVQEGPRTTYGQVVGRQLEWLSRSGDIEKVGAGLRPVLKAVFPEWEAELPGNEDNGLDGAGKAQEVISEKTTVASAKAIQPAPVRLTSIIQSSTGVSSLSGSPITPTIPYIGEDDDHGRDQADESDGSSSRLTQMQSANPFDRAPFGKRVVRMVRMVRMVRSSSRVEERDKSQIVPIFVEDLGGPESDTLLNAKIISEEPSMKSELNPMPNVIAGQDKENGLPHKMAEQTIRKTFWFEPDVKVVQVMREVVNNLALNGGWVSLIYIPAYSVCQLFWSIP